MDSGDRGLDAANEATPLLLPEYSGRYRAAERFRPHTVEGPCFCIHKPLEPCDEQGRPPPQQLLRYDDQYASSVLSLVQLRGTVFASWSIWLHSLGNFTLAAIVCAIVFFSCRRPELINVDRVCEIVEYSSIFVGFLLVFYLSLAVRRWWAMRTDTLGGLWNAVGDLSMLLAAHLPHENSAELKQLVLRYSLASFELMFMQAQGTDGVLGGLVRQKLLTDDEKRKLEELVSKPQAMWVWIAGIFQRLAERGKLSSRFLVVAYNICSRARASVGRGRGAFTYLDTQLPFPYVHLLSVLVHLNNLAIAGKCGILSAVAIWNLRASESKSKGKGCIADSEHIQVLLLQVVFVLLAPALCHAVLAEVAGLGDPFGDRFQDFPRRAYHIWMRSECEALLAAGELRNQPSEALKVTEEFEVREGDLVQDRVTIV